MKVMENDADWQFVTIGDQVPLYIWFDDLWFMCRMCVILVIRLVVCFSCSRCCW